MTNFLINDLLTYCNKVNIDLDEWYVHMPTIILIIYTNFNCLLFSILNYYHLKDILNALHTEAINLQAARKLIELVDDAEQEIDEVNF